MSHLPAQTVSSLKAGPSHDRLYILAPQWNADKMISKYPPIFNIVEISSQHPSFNKTSVEAESHYHSLCQPPHVHTWFLVSIQPPFTGLRLTAACHDITKTSRTYSLHCQLAAASLTDTEIWSSKSIDRDTQERVSHPRFPSRTWHG